MQSTRNSSGMDGSEAVLCTDDPNVSIRLSINTDHFQGLSKYAMSGGDIVRRDVGMDDSKVKAGWIEGSVTRVDWSRKLSSSKGSTISAPSIRTNGYMKFGIGDSEFISSTTFAELVEKSQTRIVPRPDRTRRDRMASKSLPRVSHVYIVVGELSDTEL